MRLRVVYMGTPDFAVPPLQALIDGPDEVVAVVTNPDRPAGRGKHLQPPPVKVAAEAAGIPVLQPTSARTDGFAAQLAALRPDIAVVVAYGKILPQRILDIPRLGCLNVHASVLPELRGAAPINWAIVRGHTETGVAIMQMDAGMDTGPVYAVASTPIGGAETTGELHDRLMHLGPPLLMEVLASIVDGTAVAIPQDHDRTTRAPMIQKADGDIDWTASASDVMHLIHGFNPWPGAYSTIVESPDPTQIGLRIKFHRALAAEGPTAPPGTVLDGGQGLEIAAGDGLVRIVECQAPGRKSMSTRDFLLGCSLAAGTRFAPST